MIPRSFESININEIMAARSTDPAASGAAAVSQD